jgi:hypothetical protein
MMWHHQRLAHRIIAAMSVALVVRHATIVLAVINFAALKSKC